MTARILVRPPVRPSNGAMALRQAIGNEARLSRLNPVPRQYRMVINWGNSSELSLRNRLGRILNNPVSVADAANKLSAFEAMKVGGVRIPEYTTRLDSVEGIWMARTKLTGHSGDGIVVLREGDSIVEAPLYTRYIKKIKEYRLHVVGDEVIFVQQKRKQSEREQTADEKLIRSHQNGWVYCIEDVEVDDAMREMACQAVEVLGLNFGAVDMVIEKDTDLAYVLEVNTAPGLASPTLLTAYAEAFTKLYKESR